MRPSRLVGLIPACLVAITTAQDLLFYNGLTYQEYTQATTVLGYTGEVDLGLMSQSFMLTVW